MIRQTLDRVSDEQAECLADKILESGHIFVAGAGRSGFAMRAFAMRLMDKTGKTSDGMYLRHANLE